MKQSIKWITIIFSIVWFFVSVHWFSDLNWQGRPLWGIIVIVGLAFIWLLAMHINIQLEAPDSNMNTIKNWLFVVFILGILLLWASWIFRYQSHELNDQPAIWVLDRWTGCVTLYVTRPDGTKKFRTKICPEDHL